MCREPITAAYNIRRAVSLSDAETSQEVPQMLSGTAEEQSMQHQAIDCHAKAVDESSDAKNKLGFAPECLSSLKQNGSSSQSDEANRTESTSQIQPHEIVETDAMKDVLQRCTENNMIVEVKECSSIDRTWLSLKFGATCIDRARTRHLKCLMLVPTVPLATDRLKFAKVFPGISPKCVIGTSEVDEWGEDKWQEAVEDHNMLITTPALFLDTLNAGYLRLSIFCALVVEECQHCSGRHPFARIFAEHMQSSCVTDIQVLGLSGCLVKPKIKTRGEQDRAISQMKKLMHCQVWYCTNESGKQC